MITMLLGGLWHGAAWTFVIWGALHGTYLLINHAWNTVRRRLGIPQLPGFVGWLLTVLAVVIAWVFFRSPDLPTALRMLSTMAGLSGAEGWAKNIVRGSAWYWVLGAAGIALLMPNTQQIFQIPFNPRGSKLKKQTPEIETNGLHWRPSLAWGLFCATCLVASITLFTRTSEFLYFRF